MSGEQKKLHKMKNETRLEDPAMRKPASFQPVLIAPKKKAGRPSKSSQVAMIISSDEDEEPAGDKMPKRGRPVAARDKTKLADVMLKRPAAAKDSQPAKAVTPPPATKTTAKAVVPAEKAVAKTAKGVAPAGKAGAPAKPAAPTGKAKVPTAKKVTVGYEVIKAHLKKPASCSPTFPYHSYCIRAASGTQLRICYSAERRHGVEHPIVQMFGPDSLRMVAVSAKQAGSIEKAWVIMEHITKRVEKGTVDLIRKELITCRDSAMLSAPQDDA